MAKLPQPVTVSFQAGGANGLYSAKIVGEVSNATGVPLHSSASSFYGVSVGALNATALWPLRETGQPLFTPNSLVDFYRDNMAAIFEPRGLSFGGALRNIYNSDNLREVLETRLGTQN